MASELERDAFKTMKAGRVHNSNSEVRDFSTQGKQDMVITPLMERLMQMDDSRFEVLDNGMANEQTSSSFPRPFAVYCSPTVRLSSERTVTGKRTRLHGCIELGDNLHISIAGNCMRELGNWLEKLSRASVAPLLSHLANVQLGLQHNCSSPASNDSMPRLRHRMRCRRGSSRRLSGAPLRPPAPLLRTLMPLLELLELLVVESFGLSNGIPIASTLLHILKPGTSLSKARSMSLALQPRSPLFSVSPLTMRLPLLKGGLVNLGRMMKICLSRTEPSPRKQLVMAMI